jgi:hypothetical protein
MSTNIEKIKLKLNELVDQGNWLFTSLRYEEADANGRTKIKKAIEDKGKKTTDLYNFSSKYEIWYTQALSAVKLLLPDRFIDFIQLYKNDKRKCEDCATYTISDAVLGVSLKRGHEVLVPRSAALPKIMQQVSILNSARETIDSVLFNLEFTLRAELFDSEIDAADELLKAGFYRAAGAMCGVVLEKHLAQVCIHHKIPIRKKTPTINDYNEALKQVSTIDVPTWRYIQLLGDLRNLCDHDKKTEPTKEQVNDLLTGTTKIIKTVY